MGNIYSIEFVPRVGESVPLGEIDSAQSDIALSAWLLMTVKRRQLTPEIGDTFRWTFVRRSNT